MKRDLALVFDGMSAALAAAGSDAASLTLVTGLADGADQIASAIFLDSTAAPIRRVLGAILPCPGDEFARNAPIENLASFERAAKGCAFITVLRGRLAPPPPNGLNTEMARQTRRGRGEVFATQADALLEDAAILLAVDDPDDEGKIGGTRHSLHRALSRGLPVILIQLGRSGVSLPRSGSCVERNDVLHGEAIVVAMADLVEATTRARRSATKV